MHISYDKNKHIHKKQVTVKKLNGDSACLTDSLKSSLEILKISKAIARTYRHRYTLCKYV